MGPSDAPCTIHTRTSFPMNVNPCSAHSSACAETPASASKSERPRRRQTRIAVTTIHATTTSTGRRWAGQDPAEVLPHVRELEREDRGGQRRRSGRPPPARAGADPAAGTARRARRAAAGRGTTCARARPPRPRRPLEPARRLVADPLERDLDVDRPLHAHVRGSAPRGARARGHGALPAPVHGQEQRRREHERPRRRAAAAPTAARVT